jgi:DtxR family Mn-dependent transcriptional regulator
LLSALQPGDSGAVTGVDDHSAAFLQYLDQLGISLGARLELLERISFDQSMRVRTPDGREITLSDKVGQNLYLTVEG